MSDHTQNLQDDISYMRQMAEQGRRGPILGGAFLIGSGLIYGAACCVQWAMQSGLLPPPTAMRAAELWGGASALWLVVWFILFRNIRKNCAVKPGVAQSVFGSAWAACGLGTVTTIVAVVIISARLGNPGIMLLCPPVAFGFYGAAWFVTGALARRIWMFPVSIAAFAIALIMAALPDNAMLLIMGVGLFATLVVPGFFLMRAAA